MDALKSFSARLLCSTFLFFLALTVGSAGPVFAQSSGGDTGRPLVDLSLGISTDAGASEVLRLGLDPEATAGLDSDLSESEQPPMPPSGSFDARLVDGDISGEVSGLDLGEGTDRDYRPGGKDWSGQKVHEIQYQLSEAASSITISWNLPEGVSGTLQDFFGGQVVEEQMKGSGYITITSTSLTKLKVTLDYSGAQPQTRGIGAVHRVDSDERLDFGDTAADIRFGGTSGSGLVTVRRFDNSVAAKSSKDVNPNLPGISEDYVSDYRWVIEAQDGLTFGTQTEVRFQTGEIPENGIIDEDGDGQIDDLNNVQIYRRAAAGEGTFNKAATSAQDLGDQDPSNDRLVASDLSGLGEFVFASNAEPLPVELASFEARRDGRAAVLRWTTASETNNSGFSVQHLKNGSFQEVAFVDGAGTTSQTRRYEYRLPGLEPGTHTFRLQQVDLDGTKRLSEEVQVTIPLRKPYTLEAAGPNPFRASTAVTLRVRETQKVSVRLYDTLGRQVREVFEETVPANAERRLRIEGTGLPSGVYLYRVRGQTFSAERQVTHVK